MWKKLGERALYDGYRPILGRTYETPEGVTEFEIKLEEPTAVVVALTPRREVVLVREFRPGPEEWLLELPGGVVDVGEEALEAARRELLEETGYAGTLRPAGSMLDCAYSTRVRHVFVAEDAHRVQDPAEPLETVLLGLAEFRAHLRGGRLTDVGPGYLALDALNLL
jgi:ADP-ribose pyrophosphatase